MMDTDHSTESAIALAFSWPVVRRALGFAVVVGLILNLINHAECCVFRMTIHKSCFIKASLTALVPYFVSTVSSVQALRSRM